MKRIVSLALLLACFVSTVHTVTAETVAQHIYLGLYAGEGKDTVKEISNIEHELNHQFSILHVYTGFNKTFTALKKNKLTPLARNNTTMLVSWAPGIAQGKIYPTIVSGRLDPYLRNWARGARDWKEPMFLRFAYEMNMRNMAWNATEKSEAENGGPDEFIAAWRHMHDIFQQEGATNVKWVWCPHADHQQPNYTDMMLYYPGDDVVDWIGLDGYDWGGPSEKDLNSFDHIFKAAYIKIESKNKPVIIAEIGTASDSKKPGEWLYRAFNKIAKDYTLVRAVVYFNADMSHRGEKDWRFSVRPDTIEAFQKIFTNPQFAEPIDKSSIKIVPASAN